MTFELPEEVCNRLRGSTRIAVLTGAGVSAESGVPSFREAQAGTTWATFDVTDLATPQAFLRNPRRVWDWYKYRRDMMVRAEPNPTHYALVDMEQEVAEFLLMTQNIDGLHWRAGNREMVELQGNIERTRCFDCGQFADGWLADDETDTPPRCASCGGFLRPDVLLLGEGQQEQQLRRAYRFAERAQVFLSVGTSAAIQPSASLPLIARRAGAYVIEINTEETSLSVIADYWLGAKPSEVLPAIVRCLAEA